jgi:hypothetical protein
MTLAHAANAAEVLLPFPGGVARGRVPEATQFRTTWLSFSIKGLRQRGLFDRYLSLLEPAHRAEILSMVAGSWRPVELALAHYEACDRLGLSAEEQVRFGRETGIGVHGTLFGALMRLAKEAGVTPWTALAHAHATWDRSWVGGGMAVYRYGPKEARIEYAGYPIARVPHCRNGVRGVLLGVLETFAARAYVHEIPSLCRDNTLGFRLSWV